MILVVFKPWQKLSHHLSTNDGEKTTFESAPATLCKLATCTRQTFLLAKQAETKTGDPKLILVMIKHFSDCSEKSTN